MLFFPLMTGVLWKSLYGLKQAPRAWFETFRGRICTSGFTQSPYDLSLFLQISTGVTILLVYFDDISVTGTDDGMIKSIQKSLTDSFHIKDLGPLHYFLGLEMHQSPKGQFLNQHKYTSDLIELANLHDSSLVNTSVEVNLKLSKDDGDLLPNAHTY